MAFILCIETATEICSVALVTETKLLALCENKDGNAHASQLTSLIEEAIKQAGITLQQLDAIAVSKGPGSYTGLRVGVSTAKGLCYALDKPLIGINTLQSLAHFSSQFTVHGSQTIVDSPQSTDHSHLASNFQSPTSNPQPPISIAPMIDARRMEVYCAVYDNELKEVKKTEAKIIDEFSFEDELAQGPVYFLGNGANKCKPMITHPNAIFVEGIVCSAKSMFKLAVDAFSKKQFEDVAYFEPFYLKDFVGTTPKKLV